MIAIGYRRVSRRRPCCICGKPDWCSTTTAETISFCARSTLNADRISPHGWGVYYHQNSNSDFSQVIYGRHEHTKPATLPSLAPPEIRHRVYRKLIELSPASFTRVIVNGRGGLLARGIFDHSQYGSLPRTVRERYTLAKRLVRALGKETRGGVPSFHGIPGFWKDTTGKLQLWSAHDSGDDLMLIPFVGPGGFIHACQIRFMRYVGNKSGRYVWLSSSRKRSGCGPGAPLHHASPKPLLNKPVLVTEGALKAATAQIFLTDRYVIGNSGVATAHREIVETARGRPLEIAFDNDSFTNPHVARALAALIRLRYADQTSFSYNDEVRVLTWDRHINGIDEALLAEVPIQPLSVTEWLKCLSPECLEQASRQISSV